MHLRATGAGPVEEVRQFLRDLVDGAASSLTGDHAADRKALAFHFQHLQDPRGLALDGHSPSGKQQQTVDVFS